MSHPVTERHLSVCIKDTYWSPTVTIKMLLQELSGAVLTLHRLSRDALSAALWKVQHSVKHYLFCSTLNSNNNTSVPFWDSSCIKQKFCIDKMMFTKSTRVMFSLGTVLFGFTIWFMQLNNWKTIRHIFSAIFTHSEHEEKTFATVE